MLGGLLGVQKISDFGRLQELRMDPGTDHHRILSTLMARTRVLGFELAAPSLRDIFLRIAGPDAEEKSHA